MGVSGIILIILLAVSLAVSVFTLIRFADLRREVSAYRTETGRAMNDSLDQFGNMMYNTQRTASDIQSQRMRELSERLDQISRGIGEMQSIASGVDDLKKILSNVKTRGILGEVQLGSILAEILAPDQYEENVNTAGIGDNVVEFAVKLPGDGRDPVYLPIDSKFPADTYVHLMDAYESGDKSRIESARKALSQTIKREAKDIRDKYIAPPRTTGYGIMFLPFEGLYAEVIRLGLIETLQRDYSVNIAGPTTMAALLNSLQMGFRTLAIQQHSDEVWQVLGAVKTEFANFETALDRTQKNLDLASAGLESLVGVRTRAIRRKLDRVTELPEEESNRYFHFRQEDDE